MTDKKILMVGWGYPPNIDGGLDVHVAHLFSELKKKGIDVDLALPKERAPEKENVVPLEIEPDNMMSQAHDLSQNIVEIAKDYDIIHTHDWFGAESGLKSKKHAETNWVSTIHSTASGRTRGNPGRVGKLERCMAERSDAFITVSQALAEEVHEEYSAKPRVIENGYSRPRSSGKDIKSELNIEGDMIFYVGRHAEQKGIELLIYAFKRLLEEQEATLVIGGDGHMRESLEEFVKILDLEEETMFTGFISEEELGDYYKAADVFVSPSINEPFGLTITEALESGTSVVATESGAQETLPDEAIIKVPRRSEEIKNGIQQALEDEDVPSYRSRDWEEVAEETIRIYDELS